MKSIIRNFVIISVELLIFFNRPIKVSCGFEDGGGDDAEPDPECPGIIAKFGFKGNAETDCPMIIAGFDYSNFIKNEQHKHYIERRVSIMADILRRDAVELAKLLLNGFMDFTQITQQKLMDELQKLTLEDHMKYEKKIFDAIDEIEKNKSSPMAVDRYNEVKIGIRDVLKFDMADGVSELITTEYYKNFEERRKASEYLIGYCIHVYEKFGKCTPKEELSSGTPKEELSSGTPKEELSSDSTKKNPEAPNNQTPAEIQEFCLKTNANFIVTFE